MRGKEAEAVGGEDNMRDFIKLRDPTYCDKGGHRERSIANSPQHREHWKKEEKIRVGNVDSMLTPR